MNLAKTLVCIFAIALGLYGAWWISTLAHHLYLEEVDSFEKLTTIMLSWFAVSAAILCPLLCWGFLKILKTRQNKKNDV